MVYNDKQFLMSLFSTPSIVKLFLAFTNNKTVDIKFSAQDTVLE